MFVNLNQEQEIIEIETQRYQSNINSLSNWLNTGKKLEDYDSYIDTEQFVNDFICSLDEDTQERILKLFQSYEDELQDIINRF